MPELISSKERVARKDHVCSYCGGTIHRGETYYWDKLKCDGLLYDWKSHKKCSSIASRLWDYIDPDDGMTADDFHYGCSEFSRAFICPDCPDADDDLECKKDECYCVDKIYDFLQTHELYRDRREGWWEIWKCKVVDRGV